MIRYLQGNLLDAPVDALVNTVNTVGVMGKGIALQFKEAYPENFRFYQQACKNGTLVPGGILAFKERTLNGERLIVNFATKKEWYRKSSYEWIESGLKTLAWLIPEWGIRSIALPPLGCGNGGLDWNKVRAMIGEHLLTVKGVDILVYEPNEAVKNLLQNQNQPKPVHLTPARAMLLYAMYFYESLGEAPNLFVANKLAWFLQRMGEPLRLDFKPHIYGPYAVQVGHVLYALNGKYLKGLEQQQAKPFETLQLQYDKFEEVKSYVEKNLSIEQRVRLDNLTRLIDGFQSSWSLEVLASVDYLQKEGPEKTEDEVFKAMQEWNPRKKRLVEKKHIAIASQRLKEYRDGLT